MKWTADKCKPGDMIRSRQGAVYHFGIYVSDEEVIQFGKSPLLRTPEESNETIAVLATDMDTFACGKTVERAAFGFWEKRKRFSPAETVRRARAKLGERGYDLLHNNCEHFVYECAMGKRYSAQEEAVRKKWNARPVLDVYFSPIPKSLEWEEVYPPARAREIADCKNETVKAEKYWVWKTLLAGIEKTFVLDPGTLAFEKTTAGKWIAPGIFFSLTHADGAVAVALSNAEVGIDMEQVESFTRKHAQEQTVARLAKRIAAKGEPMPATAEELLMLWTRKESAFKCFGKGSFQPRKIETGRFCYQSVALDGYRLTVCGAHAQAAKFYSPDGNLIKGAE